MLPELNEEINLELAQLHRLLNSFAPLRKKVQGSPPDTIEIVALAGLLQSFYNGIENILKRIVLKIDKVFPGGEA